MTSPLRPLPRSSWNESTARHLLNRAGFGVPESATAFLVEAGPEEAVSAFVDYERYQDTGRTPDFLLTPARLAELRRQARGEAREPGEAQPPSRQTLLQIQQREREGIAQLKWWWFERMYGTPRPLQEKLTLFWHGHFATSAQKVRSSYANWQLNEIFRQHATGNFRTLTVKVGQSAAMLIYLDNRQNRRGAPNENWARELMELFTLGVGQYTESDIREAARAFTGWTFDPATFEFTVNRRQHDEGVKTFMGRTGRFTGDDILRIVFEQEAVAPFICRKLWQFFVGERVDEQAVNALATIFREADFELKPVLRALFRSQVFYEVAHRGRLIKSPVAYLIQLLEHLQLDVDEAGRDQRQVRGLTQVLRLLGQDLFAPPNVKGWEGNRAWIDTHRLLSRYNVAGMMINGRATLPAAEPDLEQTLAEIEALQREAQLARTISAPFRPRDFFGPYDGRPVGEMLDDLARRMLPEPLGGDARRELLSFLGDGVTADTPFRYAEYSEATLRSLAHVLTSMVEYQLC